MLDFANNISGGTSASELAIFTSNSAILDSFLGGGLLSQSNGYRWVTDLLPNLTIVNGGGTGASLTADGSTAFPGLTNNDLTSGPRHNRFADTGALTVLAVDNQDIALVIGSSGGSITNPDNPGGTVPVPSTLALLGLGLIGLGAKARRNKKTSYSLVRLKQDGWWSLILFFCF